MYMREQLRRMNVNENKPQIFATNIKWETDGEVVDLPNEVEIPSSISGEDAEIEDEISDYLSDTYGWLHDGFDIVRKPNYGPACKNCNGLCPCCEVYHEYADMREVADHDPRAATSD